MPAEERASTWVIDPVHSRVEFEARGRFMFLFPMKKRGWFNQFSGSLTIDRPLPANSHVEAAIDTASIDTGNGMRDRHLRSKDFFDAARFPTMTFESRSVEALDQATGRYRAGGALTIRGISREISLEINAPTDADTQDAAFHFQATTVVNRRDFGMTWNQPQFQIADEIAVTLNIDAVRT